MISSAINAALPTRGARIRAAILSLAFLAACGYLWSVVEPYGAMIDHGNCSVAYGPVACHNPYVQAAQVGAALVVSAIWLLLFFLTLAHRTLYAAVGLKEDIREKVAEFVYDHGWPIHGLCFGVLAIAWGVILTVLATG